MEITMDKPKIESFVYKVNKIYLVVADSITEVEEVFKKHYPSASIEEIKRTGKVLL